MTSHDSANGMRMGPEQQMPDLVGHQASENSCKVNVVARMERLHSFPEHVAISASSVGAEEGHAEGRVAGGACDMSDDAQIKMLWLPGPITQRQGMIGVPTRTVDPIQVETCAREGQRCSSFGTG